MAPRIKHTRTGRNISSIDLLKFLFQTMCSFLSMALKWQTGMPVKGILAPSLCSKSMVYVSVFDAREMEPDPRVFIYMSTCFEMSDFFLLFLPDESKSSSSNSWFSMSPESWLPPTVFLFLFFFGIIGQSMAKLMF